MKELEDYAWFPPVLRNFQTEFIGFVVSKFNIYHVFIAYLKAKQLAGQPMIDLCSGSGEPAISIFKKSNCFIALQLTDKFPNALAINDDQIYYEMQSVDVLNMQFKPRTCYTMFNAFHHFTDKEKVKIVKEIQHSGADAFIVEVLEPTVFCFLKIFFTTLLGSLVLTPFIRPFSLKRLLFTYVLPINLFTITFDGLLSVLKSRSVQQYHHLFVNNELVIETFRLKKGLNSLTVIQINGTK